MGEMLLNGRLYGASGIRELTQAQYDALPASKLTDGILYCIKDTGIVEGEKFAPEIYSLEEREIGVWIDGKPLYQKTFSFIAVNNTGKVEAVYPHNIANVEYIPNVIAKLNYPRPQVGTNYEVGVTADNTNIKVETGMDRRNSNIIVTLQYTKTTDVPGSGTWGTDGVPMVHYDGNEKVIGTWFGETLYEKTYEFINVANASKTSLGTLTTFDSTWIIRDIKGYAVESGGHKNIFLNSEGYTTGDGAFFNVIVNSSNVLRYNLQNLNSAHTCTVYLTIQYTKTS